MKETEKIYAARHKDKRILEASSSGGVFTALSDYILHNGGICIGGGTIMMNI